MAGQTFTEIQPGPFNSGHGTNYGIRSSFTTPSWASSSPAIWRPGAVVSVLACGHRRMAKPGPLEPALITAAVDDRPSMWADNEPSSGYLRSHVSFPSMTSPTLAALVDVFSLPTPTTVRPGKHPVIICNTSHLLCAMFRSPDRTTWSHTWLGQEQHRVPCQHG